MKLEPYFLTVVMQAGVISLCSLVVALCIRQARWRASFALIALVATAVLPWIVLPLEPKPIKENPAENRSTPVHEPDVYFDEASISSVPLPMPSKAQDHVVSGARAYPPAVYRPKPGRILLALWATGALVGLGVILLGALRIGRWLRSTEEPDEEEWAAILAACPDCGPREGFRLGSGSIGPALAGIRNPRIILPRFLLDPARGTELAWALRHELAHREGHDSRWAFATQIIRAAFWWNPAVHFLHRLWANAREQVCDRAAVASTEERATYGHFLISLAGRHPVCAVAMAAASKRRLGRRIASLLDAPAGPLQAATRMQRAFGAGFCLLILLIATRFGFVSRVVADTSVDQRPVLEQILAPEKMMLISMGIVVSPEPFAYNGRRFDAASLEAYIRSYRERIAETHRSDIAPPKLSLVPGPGCIGPLRQILWTKPSAHSFPNLEPKPTWGVDCPIKYSNGWLASHSYQPVGDKFEVSLHAGYSFVPGHHPAPCYVFPGQPAPKMVEVEEQAVLASGEAIVFSMGEVEPGIHVSLVLGLMAIDPWELPVVRKTKYFPALELEGPHARSLQVKMTQEPSLLDSVPIELAGPERDAINARILLAADECPANAKLVAERDLQRKVLMERPVDQRAIWRLQQLQRAITRNAMEDRAVQALFAERDHSYEPGRRAMAEGQKKQDVQMDPKTRASIRRLVSADAPTRMQMEPVELSNPEDFENRERKNKGALWELERRRHEW